MPKQCVAVEEAFYAEEESASFLDEKPGRRHEKGRRNAAKALAAKSIACRGLIEKNLNTPNKTVSRRLRSRIQEQCGDSLVFGVQYSINKKARWLATPEFLLAQANPDPATTTMRVVEAVKNAREMKLAKAAHTLEADGSVSTRRARGCTAQSETLCKEASNEAQRRKSRRSRSPENEEAALKAEVKDEVRYTLSKAHANVDVLTKGHVLVGNGTSCVRDRRHARVKSLKEKEDRDDSPAPVVVLDGEERRPMRELTLFDFIQEPLKERRYGRRRDTSVDGFELIEAYDLDDF